MEDSFFYVDILLNLGLKLQDFVKLMYIFCQTVAKNGDDMLN